jgi:hypothetical protein
MSEPTESAPTGFLVALAILALALQLLLVLFQPGCASAPPKPTPVPLEPAYCEPRPDLAPERACANNLFTKEGRPCVSCGGAAGCVDKLSGVYCVAGRCEDDHECDYERSDVMQ